VRLWPRSRDGSQDLTAALLKALEEPAAVCDLAGRVTLRNAPWAAAVGDGVASIGGPEVFGAFRAALREGRGRGALGPGHGAPRRLDVARLDGRLFLVRLGAADAVGVAVEPGPTTALPVSLPPDLPFAAALVTGDRPLTGRIMLANARFEAMVGAPLAGRSLGEVLGLIDDPEAAVSPETAIEVPLPTRPGGVAHLHATTAGEGRLLVHLIDITEQKALQSQLAQRAKMEAVGQLAGGVAHDFNNLLTAIRLRVEELLQRHPLGDPAYEPLSEIRSTVSRAADVVRQLLTFSRKATVRREILDLGEALIDVEVLLRRLLRETIALETRYDRDLPRVRADRSQIETALVNLVVNARDAIGEAAGGVVRLHARRVTAAEAQGLGLTVAPPGDMAMIEVSDSGPGMSEAVLQSIFDPFFTTKAPGEGTGLGLATVYGAVRQAEGTIVADSPPGSGARFRIFLPAYVAPLVVEAPPATPMPAPARDLSGHGRILLVEDEVLVRGVTARLLRGRGYEVLEAADGEAALEIARAHDGAIDLMISDVIMPGMDGPDLLAAARPYLRGAPVLFVSGYAEAEVSDLLEDQTQVSFLAKPLDIATLAEHVKRRLAGAREGGPKDA
jgi:two-component system cell cycle sensor histidine kinase/response regulator CckA